MLSNSLAYLIGSIVLELKIMNDAADWYPKNGSGQYLGQLIIRAPFIRDDEQSIGLWSHIGLERILFFYRLFTRTLRPRLLVSILSRGLTTPSGQAG